MLRFDFTGLGGSGGDFSNTHFSSNVDDLIMAADWLGAPYDPGHVVHQFGPGLAVIEAQGEAMVKLAGASSRFAAALSTTSVANPRPTVSTHCAGRFW